MYQVIKKEGQFNDDVLAIAIPSRARFLDARLSLDRKLIAWFQINQSELRTQLQTFILIPTGGIFAEHKSKHVYLKTFNDGHSELHLYLVIRY